MSNSMASNRPKGKTRTSTLSDRPTCKHCGRLMKVFKRSKPRPVVGLLENYDSVDTYYRCGYKECPGGREKPIKAGNLFYGPYEDFDFDVQARICELRYQKGRSYEDISADMKHDYTIDICIGSIGNILKIYEIGCAQKYGPMYIEKINTFGGIILTIDGLKPLKGREEEYVAYDYNSGLTLGSRLMQNQKEETICEFLEDVKQRVKTDLPGVRILGIISDALPVQRYAVEKVFPGVPYCLCHFHFYNFVLVTPKEADSRLLTAIRETLRGMSDIKKHKDARSVVLDFVAGDDFVVHVLETLYTLSNWSRKKKDPCFTGLELFKRVKDIDALLVKALANVDKGIFTKEEARVVNRLHEKLETCITTNTPVATELELIKYHLEIIKDILADADISETEGLQKLEQFCIDLDLRQAAIECGEIEKTFIESFTNFVRTKGDYLFNYKLVPGAPTTNNAHELKYKQLKHLLRKMIGFAAANCFLLAHGERIVYVNPAESHEEIKRILSTMDLEKARDAIATERHSRDALSIIMHDVEEWETQVSQLAEMIDFLIQKQPTIN